MADMHNSTLEASFESVNNVNIWWFPKDFCQSRFGKFCQSGFNSCTLISLIFGNKISSINISINSPTELQDLASKLIGESINDGNHVYQDLIEANCNLNVPDAIMAIHEHNTIDFELEEWFYTQVGSEPKQHMAVAVDILHVLNTSIDKYMECADWKSHNLLCAAIVSDTRTVMLVIDLSNWIIFLADSHNHGQDYGAVFAQTDIFFIGCLVDWFVSMIDKVFDSQPEIYEISFLSTMPNVAKRIPPAFQQFGNDLIKKRATEDGVKL